MKNGKRHHRYDPVFIRSRFVDDDYKYGCHQEGQQQAPAFSHMNQHFIQIILNIKSTDNKRNDQQADRDNDPDG